MNIKALHISKSRLYPIVVLDRILSHHVRHVIHYVLDRVLLMLCIAIIFLHIARITSLRETELFIIIAPYISPIVGITLIVLSILLSGYLLELFFRFAYFREGVLPWRTRGRGHATDLLSLAVLKILYAARDGDVTKSFLRSAEGAHIMLRAGVMKENVNGFLSQRSGKLIERDLSLSANIIFDINSLARFIFDADEEFRDFLFQHNVRDSDLLGAARWVIHEKELQKRNERWWTREELVRIKGIGTDWSYGEAFTLKHFGREVLESYNAHASALSVKDEREVQEIERVLSRRGEANVLLVGEKGAGTLDIVFDFARKISMGSVVSQLEHKKVFLLNTTAIIASVRGKEEFEALMLTLFEEAIKSGNLIIVLPDLPAFMRSAKMLGSDVVSILDPYLSSPKLHVIAISDLGELQGTLEQNSTLMARFEKVSVSEPSGDEMIMILEHVAEDLEAQEGVFFTYSAIDEALRSAENYLTDGVLPDKAIDVLVEAVPHITTQEERIIKRADILSLITKKTNIPMGDISTSERIKLMDLERFLHGRVVGQDEAVTLVSQSMRRARAGVRNMKRPIGSFLFLGPTGVGKTETAKALAEVFFGSEDAVARFDMSEYQTADALERLIGFFEGDKVGTLAKVLKSKPYGVLLLDEFEKTSTEVMDLFLQVLDEGFFSDMRGKRVSARNVIIIATSNAGSDLIWEAVQGGGDLPHMKNEIVAALIERGIFKPELLNRFDAVVLFHPLNDGHLRNIARLMLEKLDKRLRERNLSLAITDELVSAVVRHGTDPAFGARPMNRAIQERVEQMIAEKLIRGEIKEGSQVTISPEDLV